MDKVIPWNKGQTKKTSSILARLSRKLKLQKKWNFSSWQRNWRKKIHRPYVIPKRDTQLAEFIGIILGDGSLYKHPRTEQLRIVCNSNDRDFIYYVAKIVEDIFNKKSSVVKRIKEKAVNIDLYQCNISQRLGLTPGDKIKNNVGIPAWIKTNKNFSIHCLKGLFETDGCFVEDKNNYTQIIEFKNNCKRLREDVYSILANLGYHPQLGKQYVRLARKEEVYNFKDLINFRQH